MVSDLRHLARNLRRSPASAAAAVITLALVLGAGTSVFALFDAVLLTPPPYADPEALVVIGESPLDNADMSRRPVRIGTFGQWRDRAASLAQLEAQDGTNLTWSGAGTAERLSAALVTPGYFSLLGVSPAIGRAFTAADATARVTVISDQFWRGRLASDANVLGRDLVLGGQPYTIIGVLPARFTAGDNVLWLPLAPGDGRLVGVLGRLAGSATASELMLALDEVSRTSTPPSRAIVRPLIATIAGSAATTIPLLMAAAGLALLLAVVNLAGLLIVRALDRHRELAVRSALGAPRSQLVKQLVLEAHVLVAAGALGGILVATLLTPVVARLAAEQFGSAVLGEVAVSWRALAVLSGLAFACAWLCALAPALRAARPNATDVLRRGATPAADELRLRRVFVAGEIALAFVLAASVMLVGRSLQGVLAVNPGFEPSGVLTLAVSVPAAAYPDLQRVTGFYGALHASLENRLGAGAVAIVDELPLTGDRGRSRFGARQADARREAVVRVAGTGYFDVMRIPILDGRGFDARDGAGAPLRVVVSQSVANELFPGQQAAGRRMWLAAAGAMVEITGVAGEVKHRALDEGTVPTVYVCGWQEPSRSRRIVTRSNRADADSSAVALAQADVVSIVRQEVARLDPGLPVYGIRLLDEVVQASPGVPVRRLLAASFSGFAALALVIAGIGLFGVMTHDVASRRTELALRVALGAEPRRLLRSVASQAAWMLGPGMLAGLLLSLAASRPLRSVLFGITPTDPLTLVAVAGVLVAVAVVATIPPARRVARIDPMVVLRGD